MKNTIIKDNKIVIDLNAVGRTHTQKRKIIEFAKTMSLEKLVKYIESFQGKSQRNEFYDNEIRIKTGGVDRLDNKDKNTILEKFRRMTRLDDSHSPLNDKSDWIGVEIECFVLRSKVLSVLGMEDQDECSRCDGTGSVLDANEDEITCPRCDGSGLTESGLSTRELVKEYFKKHKMTLCSIKTDGSINPDGDCDGIEITVLTRLSNPTHLKKACDLLSDLKAKVNKSCGLHVHLDSRHLSPDQVSAIGKKFAKALPAMSRLVPASRRDNQYCRMKVSRLSGTRYCAVNLTAFKKYKTIEIRMHSSTTDFQKIMYWAELCHKVMTCEEIKTCADLNTLDEYIRLPESVLEYFSQRDALFNPTSPNQATASRFCDTDSSEYSQSQIEAA
jgi:hypothetical protein